MPINAATITTTRPQSQPTTTAIPQGQAPIIAGGVPSNVRPVAGQPEQVSFTMKGDKGSVDLVWDKAKNELFVKGRGGVLSKASAVEQGALMDRLGGREFAAVRKGSAYDLMRQDLMEAKPTQTTKLPSKPQLPQAPVTTTDDLYSEQPSVRPTPTTQTPTTQTPQTPTSQTPTSQTPTSQTPTTQTPTSQTPTSPKMLQADFVAQNSSRTVTTEALRARGLDARLADANGDGAISGTEWNGVWKAIDAADKDGQAGSVDSSNAAVKRRLDAVQGAATGTAPYGAKEKAQINLMLKEGPVEQFRELSPAECQQKGLPRGTMVASFNDSFGSGAGGGGRQDVNVYATPSGTLYKEYINREDRKNTPVVRLTSAEHRLILDRSTDRPEANTDREVKARHRIFGSDGEGDV